MIIALPTPLCTASLRHFESRSPFSSQSRSPSPFLFKETVPEPVKIDSKIFSLMARLWAFFGEGLF
ncbi:hypothetical protein AVDCRST_MAG92-369 [uncultured Coleofasciculus sp.]|uniref:Uncharacterized protein n=1 Tax=uncultured Coleofasciculus sp. TaxID=1267456 RepID=A0A6J4H744_9CYAN|nr:hypothetical protein AVDCRST_MAG92-369 [uncultured Coleofasciculus sp.]